MWSAFDDGLSIGKVGSERGIIVRDEEHILGARITIECDGITAPFSITCGIYGWMVHTRFFAAENEANDAVTHMKAALEAILNKMIPCDDDLVDTKMQEVCQAIGDFVEQYP
jgi:hypothetical protein